MASTSKNTGSANLEFPGQQRVYTRNENVQDPEHQGRIESFIQNYEKNRQVFVFPTQTVRTFSTLMLVLGMLALVVQIASSSMRYAFVPSLLGSGIWIDMFCLATAAVGLVSAERLSTSMLLDFNIMSLIATALSAILVVLNSIGLEMYTKMCYKSMIPTRDNLITGNQNDTTTTVPVEQVGNTSLNWVGDCGQSSLILMGIVVFLHVLLFLTSASCSSYICRALNSSYTVRAPPMVLYHSDVVEIEKTEKSGPSSSAVGGENAGAAEIAAHKMIEKLHHSGLERGHEHHGGGFNTPAVP